MSKRRFFLICIDFLIIIFSGIVSLFIRFGWDFQSIWFYFPNILYSSVLGILVLIFSGVYKIIWAFMELREISVLLRSFFLGYISTLALDYFKIILMPRSIGITQYLAAFMLALLIRISYTWLIHEKLSRKNGNPSKRIGIIGVGDAGVLLFDDLKSHPEKGNISAFIDDSERMIGRTIRGVKVFGPISKTEEIVRKLSLSEIIIAIPNANSSKIKEISSYIDFKKVSVKILPQLSELIGKDFRVNMLRNIAIEDLLGREQVQIDLSFLKTVLGNKKVLITGAGGSIGSEISRQIALMKPLELLLLGRGEYSIYKISGELREKHPDLAITDIIADVTDRKRIGDIFKTHKPEIVFHAAAHKHVPLMEDNPSEAFRVNSLGTKNVIDRALEFGVRRLVMISTDKAVNPTSIMGASKRLAEMYLRAVAIEQENDVKLSVVRFGNVLGSRGSVIPKFKEQIERGGPVTVTHPQMKRFFMTIPEASSLVLQACGMTRNGDLFFLDMGDQVLIKDLVEKMIILSGLIPDKDIKIEYTGLRKGEKLYEELFFGNEDIQTTEHPKIFKVSKPENSKVSEIEEIMVKLYETAEFSKTEFMKQIDKIIPDNLIGKKEW